MSTMLALVAAAACAWSATAPSPDTLVRRRLTARDSGHLRWGRWPASRTVMVLLGGCVAAGCLSVGGAPILVLGLTAVFVAWAVASLRARTRASVIRRGRAQEVAQLCDALSAELTTGTAATAALTHAAVDWPILAPVANAARLGGDVAEALDQVARLPGAGALSALAAAWRVSTRSGASLAGVLRRLSDTLRDDQEARREIDASLAAPRATARLLAVLPVIGLALGSGVGSDPVQVLTGSMLGAGCVAFGSMLAVTGVFWVERIAAGAEP